MTVRKTEIQKTFLPIFQSFGIPKFTVEYSGRHPKLVFQHKGEEHRVVFSASPSDRRAFQNKISFLKRYIRNLNEHPTLQ